MITICGLVPDRDVPLNPMPRATSSWSTQRWRTPAPQVDTILPCEWIRTREMAPLLESIAGVDGRRLGVDPHVPFPDAVCRGSLRPRPGHGMACTRRRGLSLYFVISRPSTLTLAPAHSPLVRNSSPAAMALWCAEPITQGTYRMTPRPAIARKSILCPVIIPQLTPNSISTILSFA